MAYTPDQSDMRMGIQPCHLLPWATETPALTVRLSRNHAKPGVTPGRKAKGPISVQSTDCRTAGPPPNTPNQGQSWDGKPRIRWCGTTPGQALLKKSLSTAKPPDTIRTAGLPAQQGRKGNTMKKHHYIITLICSLVVLSGALTAQAQVVPMNDSELAGITGQAGFSTLGNYAGFQRDIATNTLSGLNLSDLSYQAERTGEVSNIRVANDGSSFSFDIKNPGVTIRNFETSLQLGNGAGAGNSLGTVSVEHIRVTTHGTVRITVR